MGAYPGVGACPGHYGNGNYARATSNDTVVMGGLFTVHERANNTGCGQIRIYYIQYVEAMITHCAPLLDNEHSSA